jgi:membrane fusion protein (multidrug efflux system)
MGPWYKEDWVVEKGIGPGETVIVDGIQKVRPGATVTATPYTPPAAKPAASKPLEATTAAKPSGK